MKIRKDTVVESSGMMPSSSSEEEHFCTPDDMVVDESEDMEEFITDYCDDPDAEYPREKYVAGYSVDEMEVQERATRDSYTNWEVNEYLGNYFRFFGQKDMDIIYMYFLSGKKQEDLVKILGKSQPAISYDVTRIKEQIDFVIKLVSSVDDFIMFIVDDSNGLNTYDREMLTLFFYSTSIVKTSRLMGINNITCRSHLNTVVNRLLSNGHVDMYNLFKYIMSNLNNVKKYVARGEASI